MLFVPKIRLCWVILRHLSILEICIKMLLGQGLKKWNWFLDILFSITFILSNYAEDINFKNIIPQSTLKSIKYFSHSDFFLDSKKNLQFSLFSHFIEASLSRECKEEHFRIMSLIEIQWRLKGILFSMSFCFKTASETST